MPKLTKKCFDILHQRMLASEDYKAGYDYGSSVRSYYERLDASDLRMIRSIYIQNHSQYTAGLARVCLEVMIEKTSGEVAA